MKPGKRYVTGVIMLAALALSFSLAWAQTPAGEQQEARKAHIGKRMQRGARGFRAGNRGMRGVNLTDAQKEQMKQIRTSFQERTKYLREQLSAGHQALREARQNGTFNEALAQQKLTELASVRAKLMTEQYQMHQQIEAVLTPEQKAQMQQMREQRQARREQFKARRAERRAQRKQQ